MRRYKVDVGWNRLVLQSQDSLDETAKARGSLRVAYVWFHLDQISRRKILAGMSCYRQRLCRSP